jgi:hypothetical protein
MHVPASSESVRDAMPVFFEMLSEESEPSVRVVLGHSIFVYIHIVTRTAKVKPPSTYSYRCIYKRRVEPGSSEGV